MGRRPGSLALSLALPFSEPRPSRTSFPRPSKGIPAGEIFPARSSAALFASAPQNPPLAPARPSHLWPADGLPRPPPRTSQRTRRSPPLRHGRQRTRLHSRSRPISLPRLRSQAPDRSAPLATRPHRIRVRKPQFPRPRPLPHRLRRHRLLAPQLARLPPHLEILELSTLIKSLPHSNA